MTRAVFFNMFRNGDLFVVREFVRSMIQQMPQYEWYYAHGNHPESLSDLPCVYIPIPHFHEVCASVGCTSHEVSELLPVYKPLMANEIIRQLSAESNLYINTWAGCWHGHVFPTGTYPNMNDLMVMWNLIGDLVYKKTKDVVTFPLKPLDYFPIVDKKLCDTRKVDEAIEILSGYKKIVLVANGNALSGQSKLHSHHLNNVIIKMSEHYPEVAFVLTQKISCNISNIFFTDDFFAKKFDLIDISAFSQFCDVIVGKNSGPFTYAHTQQNVLDANKTFVSFSNLSRDNLLHDIKDAKCTFVHSSTESHDEVLSILRDIIK
jgi:hypothetical protein